MAKSAIVGCVVVPGGFQYNVKLLLVDAFGNGMVALEGGGLVPQLKTLTCPGKGGTKTPVGKLMVNISVSVAVPLQGSLAAFVALMVTGNTPVAVGVPEITPVVVLTVKPPGKSVAL